MRKTPSPIELMSAADVRDAMERGDGVAVLDSGLRDVLFADASARALLGIAAPVSDAPLPLAPALPAARQVRSVARVLEARGTAGLLLRAAGRGGSRVLQATLARREADLGASVLLTVAGAAESHADAARILADAGFGEGAGAVFLDGLMRLATPAFDADVVRDLEGRMAAFQAGSQALATEDDGSARVTLARAPFGHIMVLAEPSERPAEAIEPVFVPQGAGAIEPTAPFSPGFSSFSVKRPKLGESRGTMSMRALLQRWHLRGPSAGAPPATAATEAPRPVPDAGPRETVGTTVAEERLPGEAVEAAPEPAIAAGSATEAATSGTPAREAVSLRDETAPPEPAGLRSLSGAPAAVAETSSIDTQAEGPAPEGAALDNLTLDDPAPQETAPTAQADLGEDPSASADIADARSDTADEAARSAATEEGEDAEAPAEAAADDPAADRLVRPSLRPLDDEDISAMAAIEAGSSRPERVEARALSARGGVPPEPAAAETEAEAPLRPSPSTAIPGPMAGAQDPATASADDAALDPEPARVGAAPDAAEPRTDMAAEEAADVAAASAEEKGAETPAALETAGDGTPAEAVASPEIADRPPATVDTDTDEATESEAPDAAIGTPEPVDRAEPVDRPTLGATPAEDALPEADLAGAEASEPHVPDAGADLDPLGSPPVAEDGLAPSEPSVAAFEPRFDVAPVRFVWQIDREGAFRFLSPDFAGAVGPNAADVVGRSFADVARVFGFDGTGEIARLLERRDTWSGRSILWPVEASARKVPVDLAALPVYGRDRSFDGFRGFGVVRMNESVADDEALGLHLTPSAPVPADRDGDAPPAAPGTEAGATDGATDPAAPKAIFRTFEADRSNGVFGRRAEPPQPVPEARAETQPAPKVIRLEERRRPRDGVLSQAEEAAFRAIGAKLGTPSEAESPGALRFADTPPAAPDSRHPDGAAPAGDETDERAEPTDGPEADGPEANGTAGTAQEAPLPASQPVSQPYDLSSSHIEGAAPAEARAMAGAIEDLASGDAAADVGETGPAPETGLVLPPAGSEQAPEPSLADETASGDLGPEETSEEEEAPEDAGPPVDLALFESLFASLPLAVLVQSRERLVYANAEFSALTGHPDAAGVEAAGGLDALIVDRGEAGAVLVRGADGGTRAVRAHMQRVAEGGRSALLMSFSPIGTDADAAPADAGPALEDLRQQVEELQAVLDTATDGVVLLDAAGAIRAMNGSAHALFGIGPNAAAGEHVSSLFALESQKSMLDYLEMLRDDGIGGILNDGREVIGRVAQGGFIPLFVTVGRLSGERGWCVVIRDIAHWKRIEEDLVNARRQAEAASLHKSRFLANISHELRTPLNAIIGFADVMASECFGPIGNDRYLEYLGDIKRSGHHVLDLVNDLLDISKIEAGKLDLSFEAVLLNEVVSEVVSLMQPQANRERVIVRSNLPSSVPPVVADRRTMRQIALNLVANAIRFTPAGGQIIASTTYTAEGEVLLRFRDSGIGMTEREIEIALTPFQQVHAPGATRGEGTGLGLPLTKAMVEANRAQFAIHSTPGEGTLVEIAFPSPRVLAD